MHSDLALLLSEAKGELRFYKNEVLKDVLYYSGVRKSAGCLQKSEEPLFLNIYKELEILPVFYDSMIR